MGISPVLSKKKVQEKISLLVRPSYLLAFMAIKRYEEEFAGKPLIVEFGRLANLASGTTGPQKR